MKTVLPEKPRPHKYETRYRITTATSPSVPVKRGRVVVESSLPSSSAETVTRASQKAKIRN